jgi:Protein of unknown function (DUF2591)
MKTSELTGSALDWAVVVANGVPKSDIKLPRKTELDLFKRIYRLTRDPETGKLDGSYSTGPEFLASSHWSSGGPIIEREKITVSDCEGGWSAGLNGTLSHFGPTPLIAAMRCYVASKLGVEVEVPVELWTV